jgi:hypothetical protein
MSALAHECASARIRESRSLALIVFIAFSSRSPAPDFSWRASASIARAARKIDASTRS